MMRKKTTLTLLAAMSVILVSQACAPGIQPVGKGESQILFSDDFSSPPSGWGTWNRGGGLVEYLDSGLRFQVDNPYSDFRSVAGKSFRDVQIEVDVLKRDGPDNNNFGILCRYQNKDNFYMLVASSDGYYGIAKLKNGQHSMIGTDQLQYSDAILPGRVVNHLRVDCVGETLTLYANGLKLLEAQDADFRSGDVGLTAGTYKEKGVDILFDQFVVKVPGD